MRKSIIFALMLTIAAQGAWAKCVDPQYITPATSEGPWTFSSETNRYTQYDEYDDMAYYWMDPKQGGSWIFCDGWADPIQFHDADNGTGFGLYNFQPSYGTSRYGVFSHYQCTQNVPSYTLMRLTCTMVAKAHTEPKDDWEGKEKNIMKMASAIYVSDEFYQLNNEDVDYTGDFHYMTENRFLLTHVVAAGNDAISASVTKTFDFDNSNQSNSRNISWYLMHTIVNDKTGLGDIHCDAQWGGFKVTEYSWESFYYQNFSFDANGGSGTMDAQKIMTSGNLTANAFVRDGFSFDGWATTPNGNVAYTDQQAITVTESNKGAFILYAVWKPTAAGVIAKINAIGEVVYTAECKEHIDAAREMYDALEDKSGVTNYSTLEAAETLYNAVDAVVTKIAAIGEVTYPGSAEAIAQANEAYDELNAEAKALVINYGDLRVAQDLYAVLGAMNKIATIGTVTYIPECKALIDAARTAYNALTDGQKTLVTNYATLLAAEAAYADLVKTVVLFEDKDAAELKSESKTIEYPELPAGASKWQTVEKDASDKTIVIKAAE